jgi:hypothetical protein
MKFWMLVCFSAMMLAAQSAGAPEGIPAGAVKAADGYHYKDGDGRQWIYRPTPFGLSKVRAEDAASAKAAKTAMADDGVRATDHGETVSFERPGPFGVYRWERKKSELDASERVALQRATTAKDRK